MQDSSISTFLEHKVARGKNSFSLKELREETGKSESALLQVLIRLREKKDIATPVPGFHIIIPPKYKKLGCLPADEFVDSLMSYLEERYYVGLLSAAMHYGAAHQAPQKFFVMVEKKRRDIKCGSVHIVFVQNKNFPSELLVQRMPVPSGFLNISNPELTALDLVRHLALAGGISHVSTVLRDLLKTVKEKHLANLISHEPSIRSLQRLGFLTDFLGYTKLGAALHLSLSNKIYRHVGLVHGITMQGEKDKKWKIIINHKIKTDI